MKKIMYNHTKSYNYFDTKTSTSNHMFPFLTTFFVLLLSAILTSLATANSASAVTYQTGVGVSFTFNPKLTLSLSSSNLLIPSLAPGTTGDSNEITITISTNAAYGYNLSATVGNSTTYNNTDLTHTSGSSAGKFTSIAYESNPSNYISSFTTDNTWGYSIDSGTKYNGLPLYSDTTNIATLKSTDTTPSTGTDTINFLIGAKASTTQPTGDYKNVINFIAVTNPVPTLEPVACESGKICYNENSLDPVEGTMGKQSASANSSVTLLASNFSRTGYGFAGWSDVHDYDTNPNAHFYGPQEDITTPSDMSAGLPLYAVWVRSAGYMQTDASRVCNTLTTAPTDGTANLASVSALTDQRDNQTYAIAKLADGNCWMIENLRLENTNSDNSTGALAQGYGTSATYGNFSGLADPESANFTNSTTANSLYYSGTQSGDATINIGTSNDPGYRMPRYNNLNTPDNASDRPQNPTSNTFTNDNMTVGMYSYGNYYTWHATIANTIHYGSPTATDANGKTSENVDTSLCPTRWRIPYGNSSGNGIVSGGFYNLIHETINDIDIDSPVVSQKIRSFPNNFLLSGYFSSSSANNRGSLGDYWSSTAYNDYRGYYLSLSNTYVSPGTNNNDKYYGRAIRCTLLTNN